MDYYLNQIGQKFGIEFHYDSTFDLETGFLSSVSIHKLSSHPVVHYCKRIDFATSDSLNAPITAEDIIVGYSLGSEDAEYSQIHFFGNINEDPEDRFGVFLQAVSVHYGKGRVIAFSDSTIFSNFSMFIGSNPEFFLGMTDYLNRKNTLFSRNYFLILILLPLFFLVYLDNDNLKDILTFILLISVISFSISSITYSEINQNFYSPPAPRYDYKKILFDDEFSDVYFLRFLSLNPKNSEQCFETFLTWTLRKGFYPDEENLSEAKLEKYDAVILINPIKAFSDDTKKRLKEYIENGGNLLIMDTYWNNKSTANDILREFQMQFISITAKKEHYYDINSTEAISYYPNLGIENISHLKIIENYSGLFKDESPLYTPSLSVVGGTPVLEIGEGKPILAYKNIGKGKLVAFSESHVFSRASMGGGCTKSLMKKKEIYTNWNTSFWIFLSIN